MIFWDLGTAPLLYTPNLNLLGTFHQSLTSLFDLYISRLYHRSAYGPLPVQGVHTKMHRIFRVRRALLSSSCAAHTADESARLGASSATRSAKAPPVFTSLMAGVILETCSYLAIYSLITPMISNFVLIFLCHSRRTTARATIPAS